MTGSNSFNPEGSHACVQHPKVNAVAIGGRCGDFLCGECLNVPKGYCCTICRQVLVNQSRDGISPSLIVSAIALGSAFILGFRSIPIIVAFLFSITGIVYQWRKIGVLLLGPPRFPNEKMQESQKAENNEQNEVISEAIETAKERTGKT